MFFLAFVFVNLFTYCGDDESSTNPNVDPGPPYACSSEESGWCHEYSTGWTKVTAEADCTDGEFATGSCTMVSVRATCTKTFDGQTTIEYYYPNHSIAISLTEENCTNNMGIWDSYE